ncbi:MAG TPA: hypothetical protein VFW44_09755 [Bryobacteraceae bacterium]|nr:hypothetical protein [Bryobacteraceae bacterium]
MNQGIAFARTLRALDADDFRVSKLGLLMAALLLVAWTWWAFGARVPQYESSTNVRIASGRAVAYFPPDALVHFHTGQLAVIHTGDSTVSTQVESISSDHVDLALPPNPQSPIPRSVDIEISRVSPAAVVFRTLRGDR